MISQLQRPSRLQPRSWIESWSLGHDHRERLAFVDAALFVCLALVSQVCTVFYRGTPFFTLSLVYMAVIGTTIFLVVSLILGRYRNHATRQRSPSLETCRSICIAALSAMGCLVVLTDSDPFMPFILGGLPIFVALCCYADVSIGGRASSEVAQAEPANPLASPTITGDMLAILSHELRSPLSVLRTTTEFVLDDNVSPDEQRKLAQLMQRQVERLEGLVHEFVDSYRAVNGQMLLMRSPQRLAHLCYAVIGELDSELGDRCVLVQEQPGMPEALVDPRLMRTVIRNLVGNAAKYSPEDGTIALSLRARRDAFEVTISDTGPGVVPADLAHIFDPFFRASGTSQRAEGFGLGLFITRMIVERHGGSIQAASVPGNGTSITFVLPFSTCLARSGWTEPVPVAVHA